MLRLNINPPTLPKHPRQEEPSNTRIKKIRKMGSESDEKLKNNERCISMTTIKICIAALLLSLPFDMMMLHRNHKPNEAGTMSKAKLSSEEIISNLEGCKVKSRGFGKKRDEYVGTTKPLWFSTYPASLGAMNAEIIQKGITNGVSGLSSGGKSFYTSSPAVKLRHCFDSISTTATCYTIHPIVDSEAHINSSTNKFFEKYILGLRNPMTAIPSFFNEKAIKYHGVKGQAPEDSWRTHRNEWFEGMLKDWIKVIQTWKEINKLKPGMYLVYEYLMDPQKGSNQIQKYATLLNEAGFEVLSHPYDISCTWYNSIGKDTLIDYQKYKYDFSDYIPAYTTEHKDMLLNELNTLMLQYQEDEKLFDILRMYHNDVRDNIRLED